MSLQQYTIEGMDCATCAQKIEKGVSTLSGVETVRVNFATQQLEVDGTVNIADIESRVESLGYKIISTSTEEVPSSQKHSFWQYLLNRDEMQYVFVGLMIFLFALPTQLFSMSLTYNLLVLAGGIAVAPTLLRGVNTLRFSREFDINMLTGIAVIGALAIGEYFEGLLVITLFNIGEAMEGYVADRARDSLRGLRDLTPKTAVRLNGDIEREVPIENLAVGDVLVTNPHTMIPMDGEVISGSSAVNQAPITGESIPVEKAVGDPVFAGTVNGQGTLRIRVTKLAQNNTLNRLIALIEEAESERAPSQRIIEQFSKWYTPLVLVLAIIIASVPPLFFGAPFWEEAGSGHGWLYRGLALLIIACPCALVLSAPVTIISAITAAARRGILIKGGRHLENLGLVNAIAFDKTGTLTAGNPEVKMIFALDGDEAALLKLVCAVEARSNHPIAAAVLRAGSHLDYSPADNIESLVGAGVRGEVGGETVTVASARYIEEIFGLPDDFKSRIYDAEANGESALIVHDGQAACGFMTVADVIRPESMAVIAQFKSQGIYTVMLTGDNRAVARATGAIIGVNDVQAELLPEDKVDNVRQLTERYNGVAMVGDGVNDAPALATATVGVAMGGANNLQAMETADVTLMSEDLTQLPSAIAVGQFARRLIQQNIVLSIGTKLVFVVLAILGLATLWMAVLVDVGMLILVSVNGMRPLRNR
ncbi:MAG: cation-translocating P-type ATPase [Chloroflexi bacterium]|nr:cation-translocating P-type ATPase [Chloroflexota bacterium]